MTADAKFYDREFHLALLAGGSHVHDDQIVAWREEAAQRKAEDMPALDFMAKTQLSPRFKFATRVVPGNQVAIDAGDLLSLIAALREAQRDVVKVKEWTEQNRSAMADLMHLPIHMLDVEMARMRPLASARQELIDAAKRWEIGVDRDGAKVRAAIQALIALESGVPR